MEEARAQCVARFVEREALVSIVLDGWTCSACGVFNGELKQKRSDCRSCGVAFVRPRLFAVDDVVVAIDGTSKGCLGSVRELREKAEIGVWMYAVDFWGIRERHVREDFLLKVENVTRRS